MTTIGDYNDDATEIRSDVKDTLNVIDADNASDGFCAFDSGDDLREYDAAEIDCCDDGSKNDFAAEPEPFTVAPDGQFAKSFIASLEGSDRMLSGRYNEACYARCWPVGGNNYRLQTSKIT